MSRVSITVVLSFIGLLACAAVLRAAPPPQGKPSAASGKADPALEEFFETKVRPLLVAQCGACHGAAQQLGGLRLDTRAALLKGGGRGAAVVPGKPAESLLIQAVSHTHATLKMPPAGKLKAEQIATLTQWVQQGAVWPEEGLRAEGRGKRGRTQPSALSPQPSNLWSLRTLRKPSLPKVNNKAWVRNPIDSFVLAKLEAKGMTPAPPAGKRDLMRRAYFDLLGLPPTPQEVAAYMADKSPNAYEKLVDRLLASPRYGERWARYWLDLARYADSNGYERDAEKPYSWKYRDYVIQSLNADKPYNRFVTEQLAGDELPDRNAETVAATGFLRLGTWDDEPNDPLQYRYERLDDLVHASSAAFLGLTVRCARCHDHKFDPIPQKDYYAFAAAFYGGYLDPGDGKFLGGPPPEKLGYPVLGFTDKGREAPPLKLLKGGDPRHEEVVVPPGYLSLVTQIQQTIEPPPPDATTTHRRLQLARWITDPRNPLTPRVIVNRLWQHHFGRGIVTTPNNFGTKGALPTHPELLDWLASNFVAEGVQVFRYSGIQDNPNPGNRPNTQRPTPNTQHLNTRTPEHLNTYACGWRLKPLHRLIMLSNAYRMASEHPQQAAYARKDFLNENLWRANRLRLDADALRDSILAVSGELNLKVGGPGFMPTVTREALEGLSRKGAEWVPSAPEEQRRRSVYMFLKRAMLLPLLTVFDFADTTQPVEQRDVTIVAPQALALMNNPFVNEQSEAFARRLEAEFGGDRTRQVERAWQLALGRPPSSQERAAALYYLAQNVQRSAQSKIQPPVPGPPSPQTWGVQGGRGAGRPKSKIEAGLALWLRADQGVTTDAEGKVSAWADQSGQNHHAAQPSVAAQPVLVQNVLNGKPALRFDGKGAFLNLAGQVLNSQQFSIFAVCNDRAAGGSHREIFSNWNRNGNIAPAVFFGTTGAASVRLTDYFAPAGTLSKPENYLLLTGIAGEGSVAVYQNRAEIAKMVSPLPPRNLAFPYVIGQQGNINGEFWNGDILEILVYDRALTDTEKEQVWDTLNQRYGIATRVKPADRALASLCHVLFNMNEFIYVD